MAMAAEKSLEKLGPYRVLRVLGKGGMGVVYEAEEESGQRVAVKTVLLPNMGEVRGLRDEILALTRIRHPGVVRVLGHGLQDGLPWYAMELLTGQTLAGFSTGLWCQTTPEEATQTLPEGVQAPNGDHSPAAVRLRPPAAGGHLRQVLTVFRHLCAPLAFIHSHGMVHRDLKPSNVFIREDGTPVLLDFGVASWFQGELGRELISVGGQLVGSTPYMSPEQIRGTPVDARADLYALGCMIYEVVTGLRPFAAQSPQQTLEMHLHAKPLPPSQLVEGLPLGVEELILTLLAKHPRERIGYAEDVARALVALGAEPRVAEEPAPRTYLYRPELTGRHEALEELSKRVDRARGGHGGLVLMGGESGVGKTFLASEASRRAVRQHTRVVAGECVPLATGAPDGAKGAALHPFRRLFQLIGDQCREMGVARAEALLGPRAKVLAPYEPSLRHLPGQEAHPEPPEVSAEVAHRRLLEVFSTTLAAFVAQEGALVLVLDDLQWADDLSMAVLESLSPAFLETRGLLILGTYRSEEVNPRLKELLERAGVERLSLNRLDERAVGTMVSDMLALPQPPQSFVHFLARQSEGNPFFVAEYLRTAVSEGLISREAGLWRFAQGGDQARYEQLPLPQGMGEMVRRRLSVLPAELRTLVEVASVLGREMDGELLCVVSGIRQEDALIHLKDLIGRQILEEAGHGRYRFGHDKLRENAYHELSADLRRELHRRSAEALERAYGGRADFVEWSGVLAQHYQAAEVWPKAVDYLEKAGELALRDFANQQAVSCFSRAMELEPRLPRRADRLRRVAWERALVEAKLALGRVHEGQEHARRALVLCGYPWPSSPAGWKLGLLGLILERASRPVRPSPKPPTGEKQALMGEAAYLYNRMLEPFFVGNMAIEGAYCGLRSMELADQMEPSPAMARSYSFMALVLSMTPLKRVAQRWAEHGLGSAEQVGHERTMLYCLARLSAYATSICHWEKADHWLERAEQIARRLGDERHLEECLISRSYGLELRGRFSQVVSLTQEQLASATHRGDGQSIFFARAALAPVLAQQGFGDEALSTLDSGRAWVKEKGLHGERTWFQCSLTTCYRARGEFPRAVESARAALELMRDKRPVLYNQGTGIVAVAETLQTAWEQASPDRVREHAKAARQARAILDGYAMLFASIRPQALLVRGTEAWLEGNHARGLARMQLALAETARLGLRFSEARAHFELGRRLTGSTRRTYLERAVALFQEMGARFEECRAREELTRMEQAGPPLRHPSRT